MRAFTRLTFWRTLRYRLGVTGVCLAYLIAALDVPLPAFVHKDSSQPFPCQDHPCGCRTAEQCWSHCCCFTPEERWAWARSHNIEPPAYAEKPVEKPSEESAEQGWNTVKLRDRTKQRTKSCCDKRLSPKGIFRAATVRERAAERREKPLPHGRGSERINPARTVSKMACCQTSAEIEQPDAKNSGVRWGSVLAAWQCQGFQTLWVSIGAVLPVPPLAAWSPDCPPPARFTLADTHASPLPLAPPAPPPRLPPV